MFPGRMVSHGFAASAAGRGLPWMTLEVLIWYFEGYVSKNAYDNFVLNLSNSFCNVICYVP